MNNNNKLLFIIIIYIGVLMLYMYGPDPEFFIMG